mgnify:CR=1 FL=1
METDGNFQNAARLTDVGLGGHRAFKTIAARPDGSIIAGGDGAVGCFRLDR